MSTKNAKQNANPETLVDPNSLSTPGAGFVEVSSADRVIGWFNLQAGNAIQGILRGSFELDNRFNKDKKKRVYRIEVTSANPAGKGPTLYNSTTSAIAENFPDGCPANVGDLLGLDEKGFLQSLRAIEEGREVWIACYGKEPPSEDYPQGAWKFRIMANNA
jgi:hypothetical protein